MFMGTHINKVDAKKRVSVPLEFRNQLAKEDCQSLICFPSITSACLEGGGPAYLDRLQTMIEAIDPYDDARQALEHATLGACLYLPIDKDGRVTITPKFSDHAKIGDHIAFVGLGRKFEIWDPQELDRKEQANRELAFANRGRLLSVNARPHNGAPETGQGGAQ